MISSGIHFHTAFEALTDYPPLRWQQRLFGLFKSGEMPRVCDLPTGLGKTSVIPIWVISLAWQAQQRSVTLPRRLVYVVNRRTVVDQATSVVERVRQRLLDPGNPRWSCHQQALGQIRGALALLVSTEKVPLAVSTLRGELADNREWKADPARPAIIIGTVDMIGSKLLFSGYGDGRYWRAQHAGLLGQDSLIVHDEAHLTPAFSNLLQQLTEVQRQSREPRPIHIMELSATSRRCNGVTLKLEPDDQQEEVVRERLDAAKSLRLHELEIDPLGTRRNASIRIVGKLVDLSLKHMDTVAKVLIYVQSPEAAQDILCSLTDRLGDGGAEQRVALLTGTVRGYERDLLVRSNPVYQAFLNPGVRTERSLYLVSTSAGEVGIDIDADHMVCDLSTLDSMIQRLGRVNRRGGSLRHAEVDVVVHDRHDAKREPSEHERAIETTRNILSAWAIRSSNSIDVSPGSLRLLLEGLEDELREKAFSRKPPVAPLSDILLDAWSLTSIAERMPGRPEVASYLHGLENDAPETYVAWRKEVTLLEKGGVDDNALVAWFQACPIETRERLRDRTDRVQRMLEDLLKEHRKRHNNSDFPVVLLNERGEAEWRKLSEVVEKSFRLSYRTLVLPVEVGGLSKYGVLDPQMGEEALDVADNLDPMTDGEQRRMRWLLSEEADDHKYQPLLAESPGAVQEQWKEQERIQLDTVMEDSEMGRQYLLLMVSPAQSALEHAETARTLQALDLHSSLATDHMNRINTALGLSQKLRDALAMAARWHDMGKNRPIWQRYACNPQLTTPLAKSTKYLSGQTLSGYRHEFGSLLEAALSEDVESQEEADLILHLTAAHHGWARPHFRRSAWDNSHPTSENERAASEALRRFSRLQQRFGRWGLAWLESLMRCADIAASNPDRNSTLNDPHGEGMP